MKDALTEIIERLERGEFVPATGKLVDALPTRYRERVHNVLRHHNQQAMRRQAEVAEKLKRLE